ncbi:MAG: C40 family peptidase [Armatimonadetes bacterium]|nr:C40 family peptidase [Armatimonadota bacterium]
MTLRPVTALSAVCTLSLFAFPATLTRADDPAPGAPATAIQITVDSEASQAADDGAAPTPSPAQGGPTSVRRHYHRRARHHATRTYARAQSLPSRGMTERTEAAATAMGRLAIVTSDKAEIVAGRDRAGRVLSVCPKGQYLAINGETPTQYAVLMIDRSLGYVAKSDVQLLDYQVAPAGPSGDPSAPQVAPAPNGDATLGLRLVQTAQSYLGVPYVWGGNTTAGIDCSGFVKAVYATYGITLPRHSGDQAAIGYDVPHNVAAGDWAQWVPGDRMYFACHHPEIDHTAMYIGGGLFIHASAGHGHQVAIDRVDNAYYSRHLVCVRRSQELVGEPVPTGDFRQTASASTTLDSEASER